MSMSASSSDGHSPPQKNVQQDEESCSPPATVRTPPHYATMSARVASSRWSARSARSARASARAYHHRHDFSPPRELTWRELKTQRKAEGKARLLFLSAAMPLPKVHSAWPPTRSPRRGFMERMTWKGAHVPPRPQSGRSSQDHSDPMKGVHVQTQAPEYPWQYRMRVTPSKEKRMRQVAEGGIAAASQNVVKAGATKKLSRESAAQIRAAARLAEQRAASERVALEKARAVAAVRIKKATTSANLSAIAEAGRLAEAEMKNPLTPIKGVAKLVELRKSRETLRAELIDEHALSTQGRDGDLKFKMGEAFATPGVALSSIIKEWDKDANGSISKIEFKQAIRSTIKLEASNSQLENLFDSFIEERSPSSRELLIPDLRIILRTLVETTIHVKENETRLLAESQMCLEQVNLLGDVLAAAQQWETLNAELVDLRQTPPLADRLGIVLETKTDGFAHDDCVDLAKRWGTDEAGCIWRSEFVRQVVLLKNKGEFRVDGNKAEVEHQIDTIFNHLMQATGGGVGAEGASDDKVNHLNLVSAFDMMGNNHKMHKQKEAEVLQAVNDAEAKARSTQVAYFCEAAKREKQFEIARASTSKEAFVVHLNKKLDEDEEETLIGTGALNIRPGAGAPGAADLLREARKSRESSRMSRESLIESSRMSRETVIEAPIEVPLKAPLTAPLAAPSMAASVPPSVPPTLSPSASTNMPPSQVDEAFFSV